MDKETYKARGPKIPDQVRRLIGEIYLRDYDLTAKEVMYQLHAKLQEKGLQLRPDWPGLSAVQKELTSFRNRQKKFKAGPQERPWRVEAKAPFYMPPEALPTVLEVMILYSKETRRCFNNRQAKWVVRLYCVIKDIGELARTSELYASNEILTELTGIEFDPMDLSVQLYAQMTGKTVNIQYPICKYPVGIEPPPPDKTEFLGNWWEKLPPANTRTSYIVGEKEARQ